MGMLAGIREDATGRFEKGMKIALADDHPLMRKALSAIAAEVAAGTVVAELGSLGELVDFLSHSPDTDLVLLDLHLPDCSGFGGIRTLREKFPAIPVVVISAAQDPQMINRCIEFGASGFIPKSTPLTEIQAAIGAVFSGEIWIPEISSAARHSPRSVLADLTPAQHKIVSCLERGLLNKQIAFELGVTEFTVKAHMTAAFRKLGVSNRTQAMMVLKSIQPQD